MRRRPRYFVYILSNPSRTLYIGKTSNLEFRMWQHKTRAIPGFTSKYRIDQLVWFGETADVREAGEKERQIKNWHHQWKINLIEQTNPEWRDLSADWGLMVCRKRLRS